MRSSRAPSVCVVMRPDATGVLVQVGTQRSTQAPMRGGAQYGVWDDQVQKWQFGPATLDDCGLSGEQGDILFWRGEYHPAPLNAAERAYLRANLEQ